MDKKNKTNEVEWIFFDIGGVLTDESNDFNLRVATDLEIIRKYRPEIQRQDIVTAWRKASALDAELDESVLKMFLPKNSDEAVTEMWRLKKQRRSQTEPQIVRPEAAEVVAALSRKYKLGLIANQHPAIKEKLEAADILRHFILTEVSDDYRVEKPNPEIFRIVLRQSYAHPQTSAFVDDNIERALIPAKSLGFITVWYKLEEREVPPGIVDHAVTSLMDLLEIF